MVMHWSNSAIQDLKDFKEYSLKNNTDEYILELIHFVDILKEQPKIGKIFLYVSNTIIRQLIHNEHRIFYYIDTDVIHVLAVTHHRQDIERKIEYIKKSLNN